MREAVVNYVKWVIQRYPLRGPILDTCAGWEPNLYEPFFPGYEYIKQDMQDYDPPCIDLMCDVCDMKSIPDSSIGVVLNMESLEHIAYPQKAIDEIYRVLKPDGFLILTTVMHFKIHRTPRDYWRFAPDGLELLLKRFKIVDCTLEGRLKRPKGIWVTAQKVLEGEGLGKLPEHRTVRSDDWFLKKLERRISRGLERIREHIPLLRAKASGAMDRGQVPLVRLFARGYRGFVREDLRDMFTDDFLGNLEAAVLREGDRAIKDSRVRWATIFSGPDGKAIFIKKFKAKNWKERVKYLLLPSKAKREWDVSLASRGKGIRIPAPIGVMERRRWGLLEESLYVSEAIEGAQPLLDFFKERLAGGELKGEVERRRIVRLLGDTVRRIHDSGLFHADLHAGNFLIRKSGEGPLYLIDLHSARMRNSLSQRRRLWNIAQLFYSLNLLLDQGDKGIFLEAYGRKEMPRPLLMRVERLAGRIKRRHQRSRAKRCLRESTLFTRRRWNGYKVYRRRDVSGETLMEMVTAHREIVENSPWLLLKNSPKTVVSMVEMPHGSASRTCVKQYRWGTPWGKIGDCLRYSKGKVSWVAANEFFRRGISTLKPLAYIEKTHFGLLAESFFLMESPADYLEMDRYLIKSFANGASADVMLKKRAFIREFARCIGRLHASDIFHGDLKTCNILARERRGGWDFSFIDLDAAHLGTEVNFRRALKNLVQINCSIPGFLGYGDRVRFLNWYLEIHPIPMAKRDLIKAVLEESRKRGVVYVSPEGDVREEVLSR